MTTGPTSLFTKQLTQLIIVANQTFGKANIIYIRLVDSQVSLFIAVCNDTVWNWANAEQLTYNLENVIHAITLNKLTQSSRKCGIYLIKLMLCNWQLAFKSNINIYSVYTILGLTKYVSGKKYIKGNLVNGFWWIFDNRYFETATFQQCSRGMSI